MFATLSRRRYLTNFEPHRLPHLFTDVLVLGGGVAGLRAAIEAAADCDVVVVTKDVVTVSATQWAQGGIAAATEPPDSPEAHARDTLTVACGLAHEAVVRLVVNEAPDRIHELQEWGARFDVGDHGLSLGREGGHSAARIIHAYGDATGAEIARTLLEKARQMPRIRIFENCFAVDILTHEGAAVGVVTHHAKYGFQMFWAPTTIVATGGFGRVFRESTNPPVATGDGIAMAFRAGAVLRDMEMVQFHPTTLYVAGASRTLISEAVRGEGAHLVNRAGERFMPRYHAMAELAPRDVVSRAISAEMKREHAGHVFLDVRHFAPRHFAARFPSIDKQLRAFDIHPERDLIPVRPAAHYAVGGIRTDLDAATSVAGLLACGEAAASGLHGANRLASNSLLEGLVFGLRAGRVARQRAAGNKRVNQPRPVSHLLPASSRTELDLADVASSLRSVMSRNVAIERSGDRLRETLEIIEFWSRYVMDKVFDDAASWETQNLLTLAACVAAGAAMRCESRGVHFRSDFPEPQETWRRHIDLHRDDEGLQAGTAEIGP